MTKNVANDHGTERVISVSTDHLNDSDAAGSLSRRLESVLETSAPSPTLLDSNSTDLATSSGESSIDTVTLDFKSVGLLSSQGLNELISINRITRTRGVRLILANLQKPVREVFALTRLERMFELQEGHAHGL